MDQLPQHSQYMKIS